MKKFSTWLIVAGILIVLIPIIGSFYISYQQDKLYEEYLESPEIQNTIDELDSAFAEDPNPTSASISSESTEAAVEVEAYRPTVLGRIKIPSASIDLLLVEGTTAKDLNWGAGHLTATPMPGEIGNSAIAAHRNYTFGSYFSRLGEVQIGDHAIIEYNKNEYTYEVYEILTVTPDDTSVLRQTKDMSILTLITCTPKGSNTHRLILHAKLIS